MPTLQEILGGLGGGLQAFSAGVGGQGQQFLQNRQTQMQNLSTERKQALLEDAVDVKQRLKNDDITGALGVLDSRLEVLGTDPDANSQDTQEIKDLITGGQTQQAIDLLQGVENRAIQFGRLKAAPGAPETFAPVRDEQGNIIGQQSSISKKVIADPRAAPLGTAQARLKLDRDKFEFEKQKAAEEVVSNPDVQSGKILDDGTIISLMKDATRIVRNPLGERLEGQDAADAIKEGIRFGTDVQQARAAGRATGTGRVQQSMRQAEKAFERIAPIRKTVQSIDQAIAAIDEGAETGVIDKMLPSISTASIKLDTLMNQLGLDVVASTTFGALSAGELSLALDTALPTGLQPAELRKWLVEKKRVQNLLMEGLQNAVVSLSEGKTIRDIVIQGREAAALRVTQPPPGGTPPPAGGVNKPISEMTDEELRALAAGQ